MRFHKSRRLLALCAAFLLAANSQPALARAPSDLSDLVGARGAGGEAELERRGYTHIDTRKTASAAHAYWWSIQRGSCLRVTTRDGRYQALTEVDASDCGQAKKDSGMRDGA